MTDVLPAADLARVVNLEEFEPLARERLDWFTEPQESLEEPFA